MPLIKRKVWNQPRGYEHLDILKGVHILHIESELRGEHLVTLRIIDLSSFLE